MNKNKVRKTVAMVMALVAMWNVTSVEAFAVGNNEISGGTSYVESDNGLIIDEEGVLRECTDKSIESVFLDSSVKAIDSYVFSECLNLKSVTMTNSVEYINENAFYACPNLENLVLSGKIHDYTNIFGKYHDEIFDYKGTNVTFATDGLFDVLVADKEENFLRFVCNSKQLKSLDIPDGYYALELDLTECLNLESVTMTNSVEHINKNAFYACPNLENLVLSGKIHDYTNIFGKYHDEIFNYKGTNVTFATDGLSADKEENFLRFVCNSKQLKSLDIPDGYYALEFDIVECMNLESVTIANSVEHINENAFYACPNLEKVKLSKNILSNVSNFFSHGGKIVSVCYDGMVKGDCNADGKLAVSDLVSLNSFLLSNKKQNYISTASDMDSDGVVNVFDMIRLRKLFLSDNT